MILKIKTMKVYFDKNYDKGFWRFTLIPTIFVEKDNDYETLAVSIEWLCWSFNIEFYLWRISSNH